MLLYKGILNARHQNVNTQKSKAKHKTKNHQNLKKPQGDDPKTIKHYEIKFTNIFFLF
jgi:hypothetical protein